MVQEIEQVWTHSTGKGTDFFRGRQCRGRIGSGIQLAAGFLDGIDHLGSTRRNADNDNPRVSVNVLKGHIADLQLTILRDAQALVQGRRAVELSLTQSLNDRGEFFEE